MGQIMFGDNATSAVPDGTVTGQTVSFTSGRRLQAEVYAFPMDGPLQIYAGGGFLINYISDALPEGTFASAQAEQAVLEIIDDVSTKAFFTVSGGAQWRLGRWAVFGTYQFTPEGRDFLISSTQHAIIFNVFDKNCISQILLRNNLLLVILFPSPSKIRGEGRIIFLY